MLMSRPACQPSVSTSATTSTLASVSPSVFESTNVFQPLSGSVVALASAEVWRSVSTSASASTSSLKVSVLTSLRSCPLPIIPLSLSREEGMIHFFVGSHVKKPESGLFSDWIGNNTDDLRCSDWPKCRHPLVVVDFSLHFCLRHEQWIHTRVRYKISAGSVFLNLKNT